MTCPHCKQAVEPGVALHGLNLCVPAPPGHDTEQAFWDACVVRFVAPFAGSGAPFGRIVADACDMADVLVAQRRKRIAARAKE